MDSIKGYLLSTCTAAILCGIILKITPQKGSGIVLVKTLCGIFVLITILSPVISLPPCDFQSYFTGLSEEAKSIVAYGKENAQEKIDAVMQQRLETYIQEKANSLDVALDVNVTVKDGEICSFQAFGVISPYEKAQISKYICDQFGIALEDQQWNTY